MLPLFYSRNLTDPDYREGSPWEFAPDPQTLADVRAQKKAARRKWALSPLTEWNVYSVAKGMDPVHRVTKDNPCVALHGFAADYDYKSDLTEVQNHLAQIDADIRPQFLEISLSGKWRLLWVFERPVLTPSHEFATTFLGSLVKQLGLSTLLAGYDQASEKVTQAWTNGGEWLQENKDPLKWEILFGILAKMARSTRLFSNTGDIPLDVIAEEVQSRFPDRWEGDFELDATGVRFWDPKADNPTGCQIKPDGMLCFTGPVPFMAWREILGGQWCSDQEILNIGRAAGKIYYDGKDYWEAHKASWVALGKADVVMRLRNRGISDRVPRGRTSSDCDRVIEYIQTENRVAGAAPFVNYRPGLMQLNGMEVLNTSHLIQFDAAPDGDPSKWPWLEFFLENIFVENPESPARPLHYFLAWLKRAYQSTRDFSRLMGQAVFLCGPRQNGKTLLCMRIVAPLLGSRVSNPYEYFVGQTSFNDDLFKSMFWAINDEEAPGSSSARAKFLAKVKAAVVNPQHTYHAKFLARVPVAWTGRILVTLNDDPDSVGVLMSAHENTMDKLMFFATQEYQKEWPKDLSVEDIIAKELPHFAAWLLEWDPPKEVLNNTRVGVKSYFDPRVLEHANQQTYAYNLLELIQEWLNISRPFDEVDSPGYWEGTPTNLMSQFSGQEMLQPLLRSWDVPKVASGLMSLSKMEHSGITFQGDKQRTFRIDQSIMEEEEA